MLGIFVHDYIIVGKNRHANLKGMRLIQRRLQLGRADHPQADLVPCTAARFSPQ